MLQYVQQDLQMQTICNIKIEAQSWWSNIKFFGVGEAEAESNPYKTMDLKLRILLSMQKFCLSKIAIWTYLNHKTALGIYLAQ